MTFAEARIEMRRRIKEIVEADLLPGMAHVKDHANVIPDGDSDGYGCYVDISFRGYPFTLLNYMESTDGKEVTEYSDDDDEYDGSPL